ncbi:MAG: hypothetical protein AAF901_00725 [Bacteroidota bacterium]
MKFLTNLTLDISATVMNKNSLRPVAIKLNNKVYKGYFHRFVFNQERSYSITQALIELEDGRLRYFDPEFVQFADRFKNK